MERSCLVRDLPTLSYISIFIRVTVGFVAETSTFIAEAAEDEDDRVVQEAHKLKAAVEAMGGSIDIA